MFTLTLIDLDNVYT